MWCVLHTTVLLAGFDAPSRLRHVDPLSDVLRALQLSGAILFRADLKAPWCFSIPEAREMADVLMPGAARLVRFHVMVDGECFVMLEGESVKLGPRDVIVLPSGAAHVMCSAPNLPAIPVLSVLPHLPKGELPTVAYPGSGASVTLLCGFLGCDEPILDPLLTALPQVVLDRRGRGPSGSWLDAMLAYVLHGSDSELGGYTMQTKLVELMFLDVVRRYIAGLPEGQRGWLAALRDPHVGRAVSELHADPTRAWTVAALARKVGLSRTVLAQRFRDVAGITPMQYLAAWRLQLASTLLSSERLSIAETASRVGYQSEAAFNRAFKRRVGEPPAQWQRRKTASDGLMRAGPS